MTSGCASAIASYGISSPEALGSNVGNSASPSSSRTQGSTPSSSPPYSKYGIATGVTPSARATSWPDGPQVTTRSGAVSMVVSPSAWSMVTGKASSFAVGPSGARSPASPSESPAPQPAMTAAVSSAAVNRCSLRRTLRVFTVTFQSDEPSNTQLSLGLPNAKQWVGGYAFAVPVRPQAAAHRASS